MTLIKNLKGEKMKRRIFGFLITTALILIASPSAAALEVTKVIEITAGITRQQTEAQVSFFDQALNEFGASSP